MEDDFYYWSKYINDQIEAAAANELYLQRIQNLEDCIKALNMILLDVRLGEDILEEISDRYGHPEDSFNAGIRIGENTFGEDLIYILKDYDCLSSELAEKVEEYENGQES